MLGTFENVVFSDGGSVSGSFKYDPSTNTYSEFDVTVSAGGDVQAAADYNGGTTPAVYSILPAGQNSGVVFSINTANSGPADYRTITFNFGGDISTPGSYDVSGNENLFNSAGGQFRFVSTGTVTVTSGSCSTTAPGNIISILSTGII